MYIFYIHLFTALYIYIYVYITTDARKNTDLKGKLNIAKWDAKENVAQ